MEISIRDEQESVFMELFLEKEGDRVKLRGKDGNGHTWVILEIGQDGLSLYTSISKDSGWPINLDDGTIKQNRDK